MTDRLADVGARIGGIRQLGVVVNAMRGIAAARAQQARKQLVAVDSYAATLAAAIGRVLALVPGARSSAMKAPARRALVLFCAEEGFAGAFSERVLDAAGADLHGPDLFLVGTRGAVVMAERGLAPGWSVAMPSRSPGIPKLADQIAEALYAHIAKGEVDRLDVITSRSLGGLGTGVERHRLFPFEPAAFPRPVNPAVPSLNLRPDILLRALTADYLHALLCFAALHSFAAENEARVEAMAAARSQVERQLASLQAVQRRLRQEDITAEVIELAAGETASQTTSAVLF